MSTPQALVDWILDLEHHGHQSYCAAVGGPDGENWYDDSKCNCGRNKLLEKFAGNPRDGDPYPTHAPILWQDDEIVVRGHWVEAKGPAERAFAITVNRKVDGKERLPRGYMLGSGALHYVLPRPL